MGWKRFQNGLSATIAHPAPPGEKNPTFPFAGKFPPFAVLLATASLSLGSSFLPAGWESVANPPHSRSAGPWRRFGAERCRETPAQLPCGAVATPRREGRAPRHARHRARRSREWATVAPDCDIVSIAMFGRVRGEPTEKGAQK